MPEELRVVRAAFVIEEPWSIPDGCPAVALRRATDGDAPRMRTMVAAYHDGVFLTVVFRGEDDGVIATHRNHDDPLWQEDVVEVFLAPETPQRYFEIEVNPIGTTFDAVIESPDGVRSTMRTDLGWTCEGLFTAVRATPESLDVVMRIPFAAIGEPGEWLANFYRIDRSHRHGDDFAAWQPTMKTPADFHVPAAFGRLRFE